MKRIIAIITVLTAFVVASTAMAQTPLSASEGKQIAQSVSKNYKNWSTVSLSGKLSSNLLPISPSVKIFMRRGNEVTISVRAIFVGEVARARLRGDSILVVNKMNKTYVAERLGELFTDLPVNITDLQSLILGRAFVAGEGELSAKNAGYCDFYGVSDGWLAIPKEGIDGSLNYGYSFDEKFRLSLASAVTETQSMTAVGQYSYPGKKTQIDVSLTFKSKNYSATLVLDKPDYGASAMDDIKLDKKYKRQNLRTFLKNIMKF